MVSTVGELASDVEGTSSREAHSDCAARQTELATSASAAEASVNFSKEFSSKLILLRRKEIYVMLERLGRVEHKTKRV